MASNSTHRLPPASPCRPLSQLADRCLNCAPRCCEVADRRL